MMYQIKFTEEALKDIARLKKSGNKSVFKEIGRLVFGTSRASAHRNWSGRTIETL